MKPTPERNYYVLSTFGMGAHRMNVPEELADQKLERAEIIVTLPPDWKIGEEGEEWYWPIRWLKILARLPINEDGWLRSPQTLSRWMSTTASCSGVKRSSRSRGAGGQEAGAGGDHRHPAPRLEGHRMASWQVRV